MVVQTFLPDKISAQPAQRREGFFRHADASESKDAQPVPIHSRLKRMKLAFEMRQVVGKAIQPGKTVLRLASPDGEQRICAGKSCGDGFAKRACRQDAAIAKATHCVCDTNRNILV